MAYRPSSVGGVQKRLPCVSCDIPSGGDDAEVGARLTQYRRESLIRTYDVTCPTDFPSDCLSLLDGASSAIGAALKNIQSRANLHSGFSHFTPPSAEVSL